MWGRPACEGRVTVCEAMMRRSVRSSRRRTNTWLSTHVCCLHRPRLFVLPVIVSGTGVDSAVSYG